MNFGGNYRLHFIYNYAIIKILNVWFALRDVSPVSVAAHFLFYQKEVRYYEHM